MNNIRYIHKYINEKQLGNYSAKLYNNVHKELSNIQLILDKVQNF
jgi:hypothetical protein